MNKKFICEECHRNVRQIHKISYYDKSVNADVIISVCADCKAKRIADGGMEVYENRNK
jgi:hypothetical protein